MTSTELSPLVRGLAAAQHAAFTRCQLLQLGFHDNTLKAWVRSGAVIQATPGAYYLTPEHEAGWDVLSPSARATRHEVRRAAAVLLVLPPSLVASHSTAVVLHELPRLGARAAQDCHVMAATPTGRTRREHVITHPMVPGTMVLSAAPRRVSVPDAVAQLTCQLGIEAGVVVGDAALHEELTTVAQIAEASTLLRGRRGAGRLAGLTDLLDGHSESVGESRLRWLCGLAGIAVTSQVWISDECGRFARVDLVVDGTRVALEFDGIEKYVSSRQAQIEEKLRQERLERAGWIVVRVLWRDLEDPPRLLARIRAAITRDARR